jgi:predicted dehydrogenase
MTPAPTTDRPFRAAVVGGGAGGRLSLDALTASPRFAPVAAADLRADVRAALEARYPGLRTYADHREMFTALPDLEVACVSTYPPTHEEVTADALRLLPGLRGILVEKPLGHTAQSGRRILEMVRARGLPMATPHGLLAKRTPLEIIERVRGGEIGDLKLVEIQCASWDVINAGIHWLNFFVRLTAPDPITHVLAGMDRTTRTYRDGMQVETVAVTSAQTRGGTRVIMHTGDDIAVNADGKGTVFRLLGTTGWIEFWGWENGYLFNGARVTPEEFAVTGHRRHLENLATQAEKGMPDYAIPESSLAALEICEAAYLSARHGCRVDFPLENFAAPPPNDWQPGEPYSGTGGGRDGRSL